MKPYLTDSDFTPLSYRATRKSDGSRICPKCAGPKTLQARECQPCFIDRARAEWSRCPSARCSCETCRERSIERRRLRRHRTGRTTGRAQPQSHPWRAKRTRQLSLLSEVT